jgi:hypothetical protein
MIHNDLFSTLGAFTTAGVMATGLASAAGALLILT